MLEFDSVRQLISDAGVGIVAKATFNTCARSPDRSITGLAVWGIVWSIPLGYATKGIGFKMVPGTPAPWLDLLPVATQYAIAAACGLLVAWLVRWCETNPEFRPLRYWLDSNAVRFPSLLLRRISAPGSIVEIRTTQGVIFNGKVKEFDPSQDVGIAGLLLVEVYAWSESEEDYLPTPDAIFVPWREISDCRLVQQE